MKRAILICLGCLLVLVTNAQRGRGWLLGFEINPSYYTMLNEADKDADANTLNYENPSLTEAPRAWALGVKAVYNFTEQIGLQTGLRYSWGSQDYTYREINTSTLTSRGSILTELNYVQVPIMFSWSPISTSQSRFYVSVGVAPAYLVWYYEQNNYYYKGSYELISTNAYNNNSIYNYLKLNSDVRSNNNDYRGDSEYRMYHLFNLFVAAEMGMRFELQRGWQFQVGLNYYQSLFNPDNVDGKLWDSFKYTRNENPVQISGEELPTKDQRPKTTLMSIGFTIGLVYDFNW